MTHELRRFVSESAVYGLVSAAPAVSALVLVPVYTREFGPSDYGVVGMLAAFSTFVSILVVLSLDSAAQRWYHLNSGEGERRATFATWLWCQLTAAGLLCVAVLVFANPLAGAIMGAEKYGALLRVSVASLPLAALPTILTNWLRFQRRPWAAAAIAITTALATLSATICYLGWARSGLFSVPLGQVTGNGVGALLAVSILRRWLDPRRVNLAQLRVMLRYALPLVPATVSIWVVNLFDRYVVEAFAGPAQVGYYQVATQMAAAVGLAVTAFQLAWGPFAFARAGHGGARETYAHIMLAFTGITTVASAVLGSFAPELVRIIATPRYVSGAQAVPWLSFSFVGVGLLSVGAIGPSLVGRTGVIATATLVGAALTVGLDFALIPRWGSLGAAIATCVSWLAVPFYLFYRGEKIYRVGYPFRPAIFVVSLGLASAVSAERLSVDSTTGEVAIKCLLLCVDALAVWMTLRNFARRQRLDSTKRSADVLLPESIARPRAVGYGATDA